jgi:hypothetical protein
MTLFEQVVPCLLDLAAAAAVVLELVVVPFVPIGLGQVPNPALEQTPERSSLPDPRTAPSSPFFPSPSFPDPRTCKPLARRRAPSATEMCQFLW